MIISYTKIRKALELILATVTLFVIVQLVVVKRASAAVNLNIDPGNSIPSNERDNLLNCDRGTKSPGFGYWFSPAGTSDKYPDPFKVTSSNQKIGLRLNWASAVCKSSSAVKISFLAISSKTSGVEGNLPGLTLNHTQAVGVGDYNAVGTFRSALTEFTYAPTGGFKTSGSYLIELRVKRINYFDTGIYRCVGGAETIVNNAIDYSKCGEITMSTSVWVNVDLRPAPTVAVRDIDCDRISVSTSGSRVDVYGPSGLIGSTGVGNKSGEIILEGLVPVGTKLSIFGIEDGVNNFGNKLLEHVWNPAATCRRNFTTIPSANVTVDNGEDPSRASFRVVGKLDTGGPPNVNNVNVSYQYFIRGSINHSFEDWSGSVTLSTADLERSLPDVDLTPFDLKAGDEICARIVITPGRGVADLTGSIVSSDPGSSEDIICEPVSNKPYVMFDGSDVKAGGSVAAAGADCDAAAGIATFRNASNQGSSTQLAAFALGVIQDITSATNASTAPGSNPLRDDLSVPDFQTYGGQCTHDFYADKAGENYTGPYNDFTGKEGKLKVSSSIPDLGGFTINERQHIFLYVEGDVNITNNITLADSWSGDRSSIPVFYLVATGNINIAPTVKQLDGVYIAQNAAANKGEIRTCAVGGAAVDPINMYNVCGEQLVVNGAFIAKKVNFGRAYGSLRNASAPIDAVYAAGAPAKSCTTQLTGHAPTPNCAAEVFRYTPSMYLGLAPEEIGVETSGITPFMYVTSLPPVL